MLWCTQSLKLIPLLGYLQVNFLQQLHLLCSCLKVGCSLRCCCFAYKPSYSESAFDSISSFRVLQCSARLMLTAWKVHESLQLHHAITLCTGQPDADAFSKM